MAGVIHELAHSSETAVFEDYLNRCWKEAATTVHKAYSKSDATLPGDVTTLEAMPLAPPEGEPRGSTGGHSSLPSSRC